MHPLPTLSLWLSAVRYITALVQNHTLMELKGELKRKASTTPEASLTYALHGYQLSLGAGMMLDCKKKRKNPSKRESKYSTCSLFDLHPMLCHKKMERTLLYNFYLLVKPGTILDTNQVILGMYLQPDMTNK